ncbi:MAG: hypothetical protein P1V20_25415 [Verrucomicrobiales bacterium]|nr:hypothetical protein [Verrucomicrobiales bacterium]
MTEFLLILGVIVLSFALRTLRWTPFRKMGVVGFLAAFFLTGYFLSGKIWVGAMLVSMWFLFPWIELLTRTRKMRLPVKKKLSSQAPPGAQRFPELESMTAEIEAEGFEYVKDTGWKWQENRQFFRFFYHPDKRVQVAICFTEQKHFSWACLTLTARHSNGKVYRSTNIPFSTPMKSAPGVITRRDLYSSTFPGFLGSHEEWFEGMGLEGSDLVPQTAGDITDQLENENGSQILHNVKSGIISVCENADTWRYSWRGLIYLYFQALKDFVKWC